MGKKEEKQAKKAAKKAAKAEKKANKVPMDTKVKTTLINCISAVVCVAIVLVSVSMGVSKVADTKLKVAEKSAGTGSAAVSGDISDDGTIADDGTVADDGTAADDGTTADDGTAADDASADSSASGDSSSTGSSTSSGSSSTKGGSSSTSSAPKTKAEIVNYYNTASKKVETNKVLFTKERSTVEKKYDAGIAFKTFKKVVYKFMGVGSDNKFTHTVSAEDTKDSYFKYYKASTLKATDVTKAAITENGGAYTITLNLANGSSQVKNGKTVSAGNTALDRCGIAVGEKDKDYWDHKNAENLNSGISEIASSANIDESYTGAVVKAVIDAKTGNIKQVNVTFTFNCNISNVLSSSGTAQAETSLVMKNFKW